ncbi:MAG: hypothetical protein CBE00_02185 [Planctomycetaceae bacterium TMED240]|nr:hypothetical protein [Rhodopirellula sp.]OUX08331.1 MAG: hypothetical protein CBE00_02185 [Planctomycetaceae bacterium TMED240]
MLLILLHSDWVHCALSGRAIRALSLTSDIDRTPSLMMVKGLKWIAVGDICEVILSLAVWTKRPSWVLLRRFSVLSPPDVQQHATRFHR